MCNISCQFLRVHWSENGAVFTCKHEPHGTRVLRIGTHPNTNCKPHVVAATTHYLLTERRPAQEMTRETQRMNYEVLQSLVEKNLAKYMQGRFLFELKPILVFFFCFFYASMAHYCHLHR